MTQRSIESGDETSITDLETSEQFSLYSMTSGRSGKSKRSNRSDVSSKSSRSNLSRKTTKSKERHLHKLSDPLTRSPSKLPMQRKGSISSSPIKTNRNLPLSPTHSVKSHSSKKTTSKQKRQKERKTKKAESRPSPKNQSSKPHRRKSPGLDSPLCDSQNERSPSVKLSRGSKSAGIDAAELFNAPAHQTNRLNKSSTSLPEKSGKKRSTKGSSSREHDRKGLGAKQRRGKSKTGEQSCRGKSRNRKTHKDEKGSSSLAQ